jgi:hypothetical protein
MGNSSSTHAYGSTLPPLVPFPSKTGLGRSLCYPYEVTLKLKEQVGWSGDSFEITDINRTPCFVIKGRAMSFKQKKGNHQESGNTRVYLADSLSANLAVLQDLNGTPMLNFRHEFSLSNKYCIYPGNTNQTPIATIRPSVLFGITGDIEFTNWDGMPQGMSHCLSGA